MRSPLLRSRVSRCLGGAVALTLAVVASACGSNSTSGFQYATGRQTTGDVDSSSGGGSTTPGGEDGGGSRGTTGDDGPGTTMDDGPGTTGDDGPGTTMDDGSSGTGEAGGPDGSTDSGTGSHAEAGTTTYACVTTLPSPAPVCDSKHQYCLCTENSQCNSNGLNVVNNGGCNSGHCSGAGTCTGGQFTDSAGCSVVAPTCNVGGNQGCPAKTTCEVNHGGCGAAVQCCWCTSDAACGVSSKCVNDSTQKQCTGLGPCTGSGTDYDGMHCELTSPGIPTCTTQ